MSKKRLKTMGITVICELDDILVNTSTEAFRKIRENWRVFSRWFADSGPLSEKEIYSRKTKSLQEWLLKKNFMNLSSKEYASLMILISIEMYNRINKATDIYRQLDPTEFARRTINNKMYIGNNSIEKMIIMSKEISPEVGELKRKFIEENFRNPKVEYLGYSYEKTKADAISESKIVWNLLIDDDLSEIRKVAESEKSLEDKEFLLPKYGYTNMDISLRLLIEGKGGAFTYYDPWKR